jgi:hypothetical protein
MSRKPSTFKLHCIKCGKLRILKVYGHPGDTRAQIAVEDDLTPETYVCSDHGPTQAQIDAVKRGD